MNQSNYPITRLSNYQMNLFGPVDNSARLCHAASAIDPESNEPAYNTAVTLHVEAADRP